MPQHRVLAADLAATNCLNLETGHPEVMWQFSEVVDGMSEAWFFGTRSRAVTSVWAFGGDIYPTRYWARSG
jgi:hypothetical protein